MNEHLSSIVVLSADYCSTFSFYHAAPRDGIQAVSHSRDELQCASALHAIGKLTYTQDAAVCHDEAIHATATESPLSLQWQLFC